MLWPVSFQHSFSFSHAALYSYRPEPFPAWPVEPLTQRSASSASTPTVPIDSLIILYFCESNSYTVKIQASAKRHENSCSSPHTPFPNSALLLRENYFSLEIDKFWISFSSRYCFDVWEFSPLTCLLPSLFPILTIWLHHTVFDKWAAGSQHVSCSYVYNVNLNIVPCWAN